MKKFTKVLAAAFMAAVMAFSVCACGADEKADEKANEQIPNPMTEVDEKGLVEATGIDMPAPEGATDVKYFVYNLSNGVVMGEMRFTFDGNSFSLRSQSTGAVEIADAEDISGLFYEFEEPVAASVGGRNANVFISKDGTVGYITWIDVVPSILYNLSCTEGIDAAKLELVAGNTFYSVQGDA